ncbi:uncharacterized protein BX663DRAFT_85963 [Cokeromyces recurvatus]|uniref:uncharacterized protein n=1 Tax=Cokeromyces recurvatus TaxID=90255 RepID=UPI00221F159E|nr:uncharacterized protein BX663DRAFT_85963 [Cokeromyces recurvatus]KAI7902217.1 hypothetical protein BX663DRAFT_85963 [Cokeromyces recurvatus]
MLRFMVVIQVVPHLLVPALILLKKIKNKLFFYSPSKYIVAKMTLFSFWFSPFLLPSVFYLFTHTHKHTRTCMCF